MKLDRERWEGVTAGERHAIARRLEQDLPAGFAFYGIQSYALGERRNHVALFRNGPSLFALIPGGPVTLGYDINRPWVPNPDERESWQGAVEDFGFSQSQAEWIELVTQRPREVVLDPFLIETTAHEMWWDSIPLDDPVVREILPRGMSETTRGEVSTRVRQDPDGGIRAERYLARTHAELAERLAASGFRFPTSDEWEYACGAGAPTLFRWGDHVPCDRAPPDVRPEYVPGPDWDQHRRPTAFGVNMAWDTYRRELVAEVGTTRGGDRGSTLCGGCGYWLGWLILATAYFEKDLCERERGEIIQPEFTVGRRVLALNSSG